MDVSKIESGTTELSENEFDLRTLARETVEIIRLSLQNKKQELSVQIDEGLHARVLGDAIRLKQILVNILENASKYTGEGGKITFSLDELKKRSRMSAPTVL